MLTDFDHSVHTDVLKGVERLLPQRSDPRLAFLLPHYDPPPVLTVPITNTQLLLKAATIWGFIGMFRFGTYGKLNISNLTVVGRLGHEHPVISGCQHVQQRPIANIRIYI